MQLKNTFLFIGVAGLFAVNPANAFGSTWFSPENTLFVSVTDEELDQRQESDRLTEANWEQHPEIKAVRRLVQLVNAGLRKAAFKTSKREFEYCEPYEDTLRRISVDSRGVVRRYEKQAGSEDSSLTWQHYYDDSGRLRFVFISGAAVNGANLEHRIYFDESGQRIWEGHKYLKGPEYSFPEVWPDGQLQKVGPAKAFAAASRCPATKVRKRFKGSSTL
ncbi:MAG: hypothetical protein ABR568_16870 [Pyrinomonadaceae bacterium]